MSDIYKSGVIAAGHPETAAAGAEILRQGGNAVDAAVAATFASFVAESALVSIGGGGIAQIYNPTTGQAIVYDFFSMMPGLKPDIPGSPVPVNSEELNSSLDFRRVLIDFGSAQQPFYIGRGSVAVPGVVAGLCTMVEEMGTLPLSTILAPAIRLAREGVTLTEIHAYITNLLKPILTDTSGVAAIFAPENQMVQAGQKLYFTALSDTLEQLSQQGPALFYAGSISKKIIADQQAHGGLATETDLIRYEVLRNEPIRVDYRGFTILLPALSSTGGILIAFALKLLNSYSLSNLDHNEFDHLRLLIEVMRLTNIARADWDNRAAEAGATIPQANHPSLDRFLAAGNIEQYSLKLGDALAGTGIVSEPVFSKGPANTTHLSVADVDGMIVGVTTSAGESAGFVIGDTGVMLNNMLGEIDLHPQGFHKLPPGQRLSTMMSPVLVLREGRPLMALGSGGSNRIRSAILQVISNVIDFKHNLAEAVSAPRIHFEETVVQLEGGISAQAARQLEAAGYIVNCWPARNMFFGGVHATARPDDKNGKDNLWLAVGDPRRGGSVAVVN